METKEKEGRVLEQRLSEIIQHSESMEEEMRELQIRLGEFRELEERNKLLTEDNVDYARRMMENSSYIAKLEIEVKDLTVQLEQLQQQVKERVIREQEWIRKVLETEEFVPLDTTANETFLKMVFTMHEKIREQ